MIAAIVCADRNYGIGRGNELLISIPDDLKRFSRITSKSTVIMGRKTSESIPNMPLKNRINMVITRNAAGDPFNPNEKITTISMEQAKEFLLEHRKKMKELKEEDFDDEDELTDAGKKKKKKQNPEGKIFIIGGGEIYKELLPYCDMIYITKVFKAFDDVDAYFPNLDEMREWEIIMADDVMECEGVKYQYRKYKNTKPMKPEKPKKTRKKKMPA